MGYKIYKVSASYRGKLKKGYLIKPADRGTSSSCYGLNGELWSHNTNVFQYCILTAREALLLSESLDQEDYLTPVWSTPVWSDREEVSLQQLKEAALQESIWLRFKEWILKLGD